MMKHPRMALWCVNNPTQLASQDMLVQYHRWRKQRSQPFCKCQVSYHLCIPNNSHAKTISRRTAGWLKRLLSRGSTATTYSDSVSDPHSVRLGDVDGAVVEPLVTSFTELLPAQHACMDLSAGDPVSLM